MNNCNKNQISVGSKSNHVDFTLNKKDKNISFEEIISEKISIKDKFMKINDILEKTIYENDLIKEKLRNIELNNQELIKNNQELNTKIKE